MLVDCHLIACSCVSYSHWRAAVDIIVITNYTAIFWWYPYSLFSLYSVYQPTDALTEALLVLVLILVVVVVVVLLLLLPPSLWLCGPTQTMASSFLRFLVHTQRRTRVGRTPLDE